MFDIKQTPFKERLKTLRKQKGLLQKEVAAATKVPRSTYAGWESPSGESFPKMEQLIRLAEFFNVSVDYLLGKTDDPTPKGLELGDIESYLQRILSGEIPIHFSGVERLTPEVMEDIRTVLKAALNHIRVQKELAKKASSSREEVVKMWTCILPKESDSFCSPNASESAFKTLPLP